MHVFIAHLTEVIGLNINNQYYVIITITYNIINKRTTDLGGHLSTKTL